MQLEPEAQAILVRGLAQLVEMTNGLEFRTPLPSRYTLPLSLAIYGEAPTPADVRARVMERMGNDPISVLENALVLFKLSEVNQPQAENYLLDDDAFLGQTFAAKRSNRWAALLGDGDRDEIEPEINARWRFKFIARREQRAGIYPFLKRSRQ